MPNFDPDLFMHQNIDAPLETEFKMVPAGEYTAMIGDFDSSAFEVFDFEYKKGARAGQPGQMTKFTVPFIVNDDKVRAEMGRDQVIVTSQLILDIDDNGGVDFGPNRNIQLGRIRDAVGQNTAGSWTIAQLRGAGPVVIKVDHVEFSRKDGTKGKRAEVSRVAKLR